MSWSPRIALLPGFLSHAECDRIIHDMRPRVRFIPSFGLHVRRSLRLAQIAVCAGFACT